MIIIVFEFRIMEAQIESKRKKRKTTMHNNDRKKNTSE